MLEGNNILIFMGIIVLLVIVATVIAVVSSVAGAARSTQHTLERENGSSAERPFKEGVVEGSF